VGIFRWVVGAGLLAGVGTVAATIVWPIGKEVEEIALFGDVNKGAYLARASGCIACHTNAEEGGAPLAGGAPLKTDFGTFYPPNLTTDPDYGMGSPSGHLAQRRTLLSDLHLSLLCKLLGSGYCRPLGRVSNGATSG
jgi:hypothetical protein